MSLEEIVISVFLIIGISFMIYAVIMHIQRYINPKTRGLLTITLVILSFTFLNAAGWTYNSYNEFWAIALIVVCVALFAVITVLVVHYYELNKQKRAEKNANRK